MSTVAEPPKDATNGEPEPAGLYLRIIRLVPICQVCHEPMVRYSGGPGRRVYYECRPCQQTAAGETRREIV